LLRPREGAEPIVKQLQPDMPILNRRAALINHALFWAVASALVTILLMIFAFLDAFFGLPHERGVALFFTLALLLFGFSLIKFARKFGWPSTTQTITTDPSTIFAPPRIGCYRPS
jgi:Protein of unknown function (DUF2721)